MYKHRFVHNKYKCMSMIILYIQDIDKIDNEKKVENYKSICFYEKLIFVGHLSTNKPK